MKRNILARRAASAALAACMMFSLSAPALAASTDALLQQSTALQNICFPLEIAGTSKADAEKRAKELLEIVGLSDRAGNYPSQLSGGQQQRVAIARALASDAKVILADEPTGNLDTENGKIVIDLLKKLVKDENYCVIVVTHDPGIAAQADVVYKMQDGRLAVEC